MYVYIIKIYTIMGFCLNKMTEYTYIHVSKTSLPKMSCAGIGAKAIISDELQCVFVKIVVLDYKNKTKLCFSY